MTHSSLLQTPHFFDCKSRQVAIRCIVRHLLVLLHVIRACFSFEFSYSRVLLEKPSKLPGFAMTHGYFCRRPNFRSIAVSAQSVFGVGLEIIPRDPIPPTRRSLSHARSSYQWKNAALTNHRGHPTLHYMSEHTLTLNTIDSRFSGPKRHAHA